MGWVGGLGRRLRARPKTHEDCFRDRVGGQKLKILLLNSVSEKALRRPVIIEIEAATGVLIKWLPRGRGRGRGRCNLHHPPL